MTLSAWLPVHVLALLLMTSALALCTGEIANNKELEAQITYYEREMGKARELQVCNQ